MITVDFKRLELNPGSKVLDIGCGSGRHTCAAAGWGQVTVIGADLKFANAVETRERLKYHEQLGVIGGGPWGVLVADVTRLPFPDEAFDLVICSEVLEHIPEHENAVQELVRVLKPGRDLVVSVPRRLPERLCWALSAEYHQTSGGHIRIYRRRELAALLEKAGLRRWAVHFAHSLHIPYWWLKCLVGPQREDSTPVKLYHRFLVWDMMKKPRLTRGLENLLNPVLGKSLVIYLRKNSTS